MSYFRKSQQSCEQTAGRARFQKATLSDPTRPTIHMRVRGVASTSAVFQMESTATGAPGRSALSHLCSGVWAAVVTLHRSRWKLSTCRHRTNTIPRLSISAQVAQAVMAMETDEKRGRPPGASKGLVGVLLEPYYLVFGPTIRCPQCGSTWRGYYSQHMKYCHFCGIEVVRS